jgi:hypothetical protein
MKNCNSSSSHKQAASRPSSCTRFFDESTVQLRNNPSTEQMKRPAAWWWLATNRWLQQLLISGRTEALRRHSLHISIEVIINTQHNEARCHCSRRPGASSCPCYWKTRVIIKIFVVRCSEIPGWDLRTLATTPNIRHDRGTHFTFQLSL